MKECVRKFIGTDFLMKEPRIMRFKRLRDRQTDRQTDRPTDRRTDMTSYRDARTHLKNDLAFHGNQQIRRQALTEQLIVPIKLRYVNYFLQFMLFMHEFHCVRGHVYLMIGRSQSVCHAFVKTAQNSQYRYSLLRTEDCYR